MDLVGLLNWQHNHGPLRDNIKSLDLTIGLLHDLVVRSGAVITVRVREELLCSCYTSEGGGSRQF